MNGREMPWSRLRRPVMPAATLLLACLLLALLALTACGGNADRFAGLYWEPASGRRIEIKQDGDAYRLYYGRDLRVYVAKREGDQLVITDPMGGKTVIRPGPTEGTLELLAAGKTTVLKPLPQHQ